MRTITFTEAEYRRLYERAQTWCEGQVDAALYEKVAAAARNQVEPMPGAGPCPDGCAPDNTHLIEEARREMNAPSCVDCGRPCQPGLRWCSTRCFYAEDGYPDEPADERNADGEDDA